MVNQSLKPSRMKSFTALAESVTHGQTDAYLSVPIKSLSQMIVKPPVVRSEVIHQLLPHGRSHLRLVSAGKMLTKTFRLPRRNAEKLQDLVVRLGRTFE